MKTTIFLAALAAAPFAAHAETAQPQRAQVSLAGLDLRNPADAAVIIQRIEAAVRPICVTPGVSNHRTTAGCIREVTREAVKHLRIPELNLAFEQRSAPTGPATQG